MPTYKISFAQDERVLYQGTIEGENDEAAVTFAKALCESPRQSFTHHEMNGDGEANIQDPVLIVDRYDEETDEFDANVHEGPPSDEPVVYSDQLIGLAQDLVDFSKSSFMRLDDRNAALDAIVSKAKAIMGEKETDNA